MRRDGRTSRNAARKTSPQLTSSRADSPARTSRKPGNGRDSMASAASFFGKCTGSFANSDQVGASLRTFLLSAIEGRMRSSIRWRRQVTPCGRWWWVLESSEPRIGGIGHGLYATLTRVMVLEPGASDRFHWLRSGSFSKLTRNGGEFGANWAEELAMMGVLPTRKLGELFMGFPTGWTDLPSRRSGTRASRKSR
jgi:hypothetical protein